MYKRQPDGTVTTLFTSSGADGGPSGPLIQASDGNFYGTTSGIGTGDAGGGTVFKMTPSAVVTTLHSFAETLDAGTAPLGGVIQGTDGNLYGTTSGGGASSGPTADFGGSGIVFRLMLGPSTTSPAINPSGGIVSGASFQAGIAAGSWITLFGTNLASVTDTWANAVVDGILPMSLDGVSVSVGGQPAYIYYISPTQIDALAPNVGTGTVQVTVTNSIGTTQAIMTTAQACLLYTSDARYVRRFPVQLR